MKDLIQEHSRVGIVGKFAIYLHVTKSTSLISFFLEILQRYCKFIFLGIWSCLVIATKNDSTIL